ncbi:5-oxoprolinase subunit PxpA [Accumulibacter sp.]|uniref:LamB/YcsF family protein n=1 Tax=Accumulibacter sp. TaxID=2053492 RepID=UPI0028C40325|nr:5-oxoprolinase subunit PxpA [Accumulibacter sp.]
MKTINLNADLGESFGPWSMGDDAAMLDIVGSANIACGFHAGDPMVMGATLRAAKARGVSVGAHPGYADLQGFGRRPQSLSAAEVEALVIYQVGALQGLAASEGMTVSHVKPHGALNNQACAERPLADAIARAVKALDPTLILLAPARSQLALAGREAGLRVVDEIFADRRYQDDGQLVPRSQPGAVIHDPEQALAHIRAMLDAGALVSAGGHQIPVQAGSICIHGDSPSAVALARHLRDGLINAGYALAPLTAMPWA